MWSLYLKVDDLMTEAPKYQPIKAKGAIFQI
jgi:hypothetical protein